ncbi:MAG: lysophospholipid acyltransferase family protein [Chlorobiaceae bacterium]
MLKVRRSKVYTRWFSWYSRRQFRRHFNSVRVFMQSGVQGMERGTPVVFFANHAYWWDGFWAPLCTEEFFDQYLHIIIEYQQLRKHRFFTRIGAFSLDRSRPRTLPETVRYAAELLTTPSDRQNALWIFPQGRIEHVDKRPLRFYKGTASIIAKVLEKAPRVHLVSVVSRIDYLEEQKPELFLSFKEPITLSLSDFPGAEELTLMMQRVTETHLDELSARIMSQELDLARIIIRGTASVNRKAEALRRFLGLERG